MSWDQMRNGKEGGSENYVRLKDGESVVGVFVGEPYSYYSVFKEKEEYQEWAEGRQWKFKINFVTKDGNGQYVAKIFQGGSTVSKALLAVKDEYGLDAFYKIKRTGSGKEDTAYSLLFQSKLTDAQRDTIKSVALLSTTKKTGVTKQEVDEVFGDETFP